MECRLLDVTPASLRAWGLLPGGAGPEPGEAAPEPEEEAEDVDSSGPPELESSRASSPDKEPSGGEDTEGSKTSSDPEWFMPQAGVEGERKPPQGHRGKYAWYAVLRGRRPGLYVSWHAAEAQVRGFKNNHYKGFDDLNEARAFLGWPRLPVDTSSPLSGGDAGVARVQVQPLGGAPIKYEDNSSSPMVLKRWQRGERIYGAELIVLVSERMGWPMESVVLTGEDIAGRRARGGAEAGGRDGLHQCGGESRVRLVGYRRGRPAR